MVTRKILIVGGGVAGWMTAAYLNAVLNRDGRHFADISLIESSEAPGTVSGEASTPDIIRFLATLGVNQLDFMRRVGATFRQSSKFVNWLSNSGEYFYHTFSGQRPGSADRSAEQWLKSNRSVAFAETVSAQPQLCELNLAPLMLSRWDFGPPLCYAFHLDVSRFASYLRELSTAAGVVHHADHMVDIVMAESGDIAAVKTDGGRRIEAHLFIDCTGSRALLSDEKLGVAWVDCTQSLICDRALSITVPYEQYFPGRVHPCTTVTAASTGWIGEIPLQDSRTLRYVYSSEFLGDDEAEQELRAIEGPHAGTLASNLVRFKTGHRQNAWVRNCIAIGNASSIIEPLEPTTLYMIDLAAATLADHFPLGDEIAPLAYRYNRIMVNRFYELLDFNNLHYCLTRRTDTEFWRAVQRPEHINDRLQAKLNFWRLKQPTPSDFEDQCFPGQPDERLPSQDIPGDYRSPVDTAGLWNYQDYECILYGMDFLKSECDEWYGTGRPDAVVAQHVFERLRLAEKKLPPHEVWLQQFCGMPDYTSSARMKT
ncbi:MAG: tryptophan 7-halogenase [Gammaproteobacteria bacterium]|nr:tryptophan 7-halogenase [Gammaproteobacteria bacterium]